MIALFGVPATAGDCRILWTRTVPAQPLAAGVSLGGLSDLAAVVGNPGGASLWTLTDRGPNGTLERDGRKRRTLLAPDFVPTLLLLGVAGGGDAGTVTVERTVPLKAATGRPLSGRQPKGRDQPVLTADGKAEVSSDPHGVDPEAVVPLADGTFWIAEEYGPSLLHVGDDGRVLGRFLPRDDAAAADGPEVVRSLPADYALRRENRGFEALAAARDGSRLWALLQSPLDNPAPKAARKTGNVRLLAFDPRAGRPAAEHVYRLGDPAAEGYLTRGAAPDDGKLCAMAALDDTTLLVLEQDDGGLARLYVASLSDATDTLGWKPSGGGALEETADLEAAGITPVRKQLVADLGPLRKKMTKQADGGEKGGGPLKLEGLAVVDSRHVLIVNDNDFGVDGSGSRPRASLLWMIELDRSLPGP
jgi:hypothetical protein